MKKLLMFLLVILSITEVAAAEFIRYEVGHDIPAGEYRIELYKKEDTEFDIGGAAACVINRQMEIIQTDDMFLTMNMEGEENHTACDVILENNDYFSISYVGNGYDVKLTPISRESAVDQYPRAIEGVNLSKVSIDVETVDLSGLSYDELVALKDRINLAMWECEEWQEVTVPQGIWVVGEDIPAGTWTISAVKRNYAHIYYGDALSSNGAEVSATSIGKYYYKILSGPDSIFTGDGELSYISITLQDGWYFQVDGDSVIFTPYTGKPDLGFK